MQQVTLYTCKNKSRVCDFYYSKESPTAKITNKNVELFQYITITLISSKSQNINLVFVIYSSDCANNEVLFSKFKIYNFGGTFRVGIGCNRQIDSSELFIIITIPHSYSLGKGNKNVTEIYSYHAKVTVKMKSVLLRKPFYLVLYTISISLHSLYTLGRLLQNAIFYSGRPILF